MYVTLTQNPQKIYADRHPLERTLRHETWFLKLKLINNTPLRRVVQKSLSHNL